MSDTINTAQAAMPLYSCNLKVWALKIKVIDYNKRESIGGAIITPCEKGFAPFGVSINYLSKHPPHVGGYYLVSEDGYQSFSPAITFEADHTQD